MHQNRRFFQQSCAPGLCGRKNATIPTDGNEFSTRIPWVDCQLLAVDATSLKTSSGIIFPDLNTHAILDAMGSGIRCSQADLTDHYGITIQVDIVRKSGQQNDRDGKEQWKNDAQGGVLLQHPRTREQLGEQYGEDAGSSGAQNQPGRIERRFCLGQPGQHQEGDHDAE